MIDKRRRGLLWRDHPLMALLEAWLGGMLLLSALLAFPERIPPQMMEEGVFFVGVGVALWCALRSRLPQSASGLARWGREALTALGLGVLLVFGWWVGDWRLGWESLLQGTIFGRAGSLFLALIGGGAFLVLRPCVYLWSTWDRMRRERLIWAMTHMQVQIVLVFALLAVAVLLAGLLIQGSLPPPTLVGQGGVAIAGTLITTVLPVLGILAVAAAAVLAVVLPPTALFAYFFSRRTTRRLDALAAAAADLRAGDYDARVAVEGQDELAQLQTDFNAMAEHLSAARHSLEAERDKVTALLQARRQLVASVSHELRTPVATLRGLVESSRERSGEDLPADLGHDLQVMEGEIVRLQALIDDLFTLSSAQAGGLSLDVRDTDVAALIRRRVAAMAPLAWQSGRVEVIAQVTPDLPAALADEARLEQVLGNLLRNGVRHTLPGGIVVVAADAEAETIRIDVRDTGEGISAQDLPHIWDRFYRGESSHHEEQSGVGLGLALVKELTEAMGGHVSVETGVGEGSCFAVRLRRA